MALFLKGGKKDEEVMAPVCQRTARKTVPTPTQRKPSPPRDRPPQTSTPGRRACTRAEAEEPRAGRAARKPARGLWGVPAQGRRIAANKMHCLEAPREDWGGEAAGGGTH